MASLTCCCRCGYTLKCRGKDAAGVHRTRRGQLESELSLIDEEIAFHEKLLEKLRDAKGALALALEDANPAPSPIHILPPEILSDIMLRAISPVPSNPPMRYQKVRRTCLAVSQVCSFWRSTALACGTLWSTVLVDTSPIKSPESEVPLVNLFLERSKNCPLDLYLSGSPYSHPAFDVIAAHSDRWYQVMSHVPTTLLSKAMSNGMERLRSLSLIDKHPPHEAPMASDAFHAFGLAPKLKELTLNRVLPNLLAGLSGAPWNEQITFLRLECCTINICVNLLQLYPNLTTCELNGDYFDWTEQTNPLLFPSLLSLKVSMYQRSGSSSLCHTLQALTLPSLKSLSFAERQRGKWHPSEFHSFILRSTCGLEHLQFQCVAITPLELSICLQLCPELNSLDMSLPTEISGNAILRTLLSSPTGDLPVPKLKSLGLRTSLSDYQMFSKVVHSRWPGGKGGGSVDLIIWNAHVNAPTAKDLQLMRQLRDNDLRLSVGSTTTRYV